MTPISPLTWKDVWGVCYTSGMTSTLLLSKDPKVRHALRLSEAMPYFAAYREGVDKSSPNTVRLDLQSLRAFMRVCGDLQVSNYTELHIDDFFIVRTDEGLSDHGLNSDLRALRQFFKWAMAKDLRRGNPIAGRKCLKVDRRPRFYLPVEDFPKLLDAAMNRRDRMICALGLYLWQRQGEVGMIRIKDVRLDHKARGGFIDVQVPKTNDYDSMPISLRLYEELVDYFEWYKRDQGVEELSPEWFLTPQVTRGKYTPKVIDGVQQREPQSLRPLFQKFDTLTAPQKALRNMGFDAKGEGGHTLRRSGARAYYDILLTQHGHEGAIRVIMAMLHHMSMQTTEIYLGVDADRAVRNSRIMGTDMYQEYERASQAPEAPGNVISLASRRRKIG